MNFNSFKNFLPQSKHVAALVCGVLIYLGILGTLLFLMIWFVVTCLRMMGVAI